MTDRVSVIITAVVLVAVIGVGAEVVSTFNSDEYQQQLERETAEAGAYCAQVYGSADTYNAMVHGRHGGIHCVANGEGAHLHEIPEKYKKQAYVAQQEGRDLGWTPATAQKHAAETPSPIPVLGVYPRELGGFLLATLVVGGGAVGVGYIQRWREGAA